MALQSLTEPALIFPNLNGADRSSVLLELATLVAAGGFVPDAGKLFDLLQEREALGSTGIGSGVAVPHCKVKGLDRVLLSVGITARSIDFDSVDGHPVQIFFLVLSPADKPAAHLQSLAAISRWVKADHHLEQLLEAHDREQIFELLRMDEAE